MLIPNVCLREVLSFFTRQALDQLPLTCRLFNELIQRHYSEIPHRFLYRPPNPIWGAIWGDDGPTYLEIRANRENVMLLGITQFDTDLDATIYFHPTTLTWAEEEHRSPLSEWALILRDKSLRSDYTQISLPDEPFAEASVTELQSIKHVWANQVVAAKWIRGSNVQTSLHPLLVSRMFDGCKQLCLGKRPLGTGQWDNCQNDQFSDHVITGLQPYDSFYSVVSLEWTEGPCTAEQAIEIANIIERQADHPQSRTIFLVSQSWYKPGPDPLLEALRKVGTALWLGHES